MHAFEHQANFIINDRFCEIKAHQTAQKPAHVEHIRSAEQCRCGAHPGFITRLGVIQMGIGQTNVAAGRNIVKPCHLAVCHLQNSGFDAPRRITAIPHIRNRRQNRINQRCFGVDHLRKYAQCQKFSVTKRQGPEQAHW